MSKYKYFNENMTSDEARNTLFTLVDEKSPSEMEEVKREYHEIASKLIKKEIESWDFWTLS